MDRDTILANINAAFGSLPRPETMVRNPNHCEECVEHEATMQAVTPDSVTLNEIGNPGWDPVCFLNDEAFCYFMPAFARMILSDDENDYIYQFCFTWIRVFAPMPSARSSAGPSPRSLTMWPRSASTSLWTVSMGLNWAV